MDRQSNKVITFRVGNEEISNANKIICEILYGHSSDHIEYGEKPKTIINYLCTDGHHAYDRVYNTYKDNIGHHIVSKSETCLVESYNSSMRDSLARLKTKAYSKSIHMLTLSINLWANRDRIFADIEKYCGFNSYINSQVPVKHLRIQKNNGVDEKAI
ncbi:MAG: hypothetical protein LBP39_00255 [Rickettsiales bacterium]|nr:hypothetical protein [Rickettsiales bacterium]